MQEVPRLKAAYDWMIRAYDQELQEAMIAGNPSAIDRLEEKRDALERGFFVLLFAQFEVELTERFTQKLAERRANPDWRIRRGWDVPALERQARQQPFYTRLALMMDRNGANYSKVVAAYDDRNYCAHGGTANPVGSIDQLVEDLYEWQAELRRG